MQVEEETPRSPTIDKLRSDKSGDLNCIEVPWPNVPRRVNLHKYQKLGEEKRNKLWVPLKSYLSDF